MMWFTADVPAPQIQQITEVDVSLRFLWLVQMVFEQDISPGG